MNYLGHLYLSGNDVPLMQANLFGDFYKGRISEDLPAVIRKGIELHRKIDVFMDHHPAVSRLAIKLSTELPKVSAIALDIYFDHLLALNWKQFHAEKLDSFLEKFYRQLLNDKEYPENFRTFCRSMREYRWMNHYSDETSIDKMCHGVNRRLSFDSALIHGYNVFQSEKPAITETFHEYMADAVEHFGIVKPL